MRMSTPVTRNWVERMVPFVVHAATWPAALTVAGITLAVLIYRLLAERGRRKTLEATFQAPAGTMVALGKGPAGPSMWVLVGEGRPEQPQPAPVIWVCGSTSPRWPAGYPRKASSSSFASKRTAGTGSGFAGRPMAGQPSLGLGRSELTRPCTVFGASVRKRTGERTRETTVPRVPQPAGTPSRMTGPQCSPMKGADSGRAMPMNKTRRGQPCLHGHSLARGGLGYEIRHGCRPG